MLGSSKQVQEMNEKHFKVVNFTNVNTLNEPLFLYFVQRNNRSQGHITVPPGRDQQPRLQQYKS